MNLEKNIDILNDYALNLSKDKDFTEFCKKLKMFKDSIKNNVNINEKDVFIQELNEKIKKENFLEEDYKILFFNQTKSFVDEYQTNGFIMFDNFQNNFIQEFKNKNLNTKEEESKKELEELIDLLNENKENTNILNEEKVNLLNKKIFLETEIEPRNKKNAINDLDFKEYKTKDLIDFINNKEQFEYPFPKDKTLGNKEFMKEFKKELKNIDIKILKEMIKEVIRKNDILKEEIQKINIEKNNVINYIETNNRTEVKSKSEENLKNIENENIVEKNEEIEHRKKI